MDAIEEKKDGKIKPIMKAMYPRSSKREESEKRLLRGQKILEKMSRNRTATTVTNTFFVNISLFF